MRAPAWYYQEAVHRFRPAGQEDQEKSITHRCSWCGVVVRKGLTPKQIKARAGRHVRICIDRQACLFAEWGSKDQALGWAAPSNWGSWFRGRHS